jgi:hypothetical protein
MRTMQTSQKGMRIPDWEALPAIIDRKNIERLPTVGPVTTSEYAPSDAQLSKDLIRVHSTILRRILRDSFSIPGHCS